MTLFAVHISDGVLSEPWWIGGFAAAAVCVWLGVRRMHENDIARVALMTAALFIASSMHVPVGLTSVHLLLNGLAGVLLGVRAAAAIAVALLLQAVLLGHGGLYALGVNIVVQTIPAWLAFILFRVAHRRLDLRAPLTRSLLVGAGALLCYVFAVYSSLLLFRSSLSPLDLDDFNRANRLIVHPVSLAGAVAWMLFAAWWERRLENTPEFPLGFLLGTFAVVATLMMHQTVMLANGDRVWQPATLVFALGHLPIALLEGMVLGFLLGYLAKVKPSMLYGEN
jgi:cobalt/nickel transport system permease protein